MRPGFKILLSFALAAILLAGCRGHRNIPDKDLKEITKEIFLSNAYAGSHPAGLDSLDFYTPIFSKYGYTVEDFRYTLANFAKRKSSRLSDIIKEAYDELDRQYAYYQRKLAILDTIDILAGERLKQVVLFDSLIRATRLADTSRLVFTLPAREGIYRISFNYRIDSLDLNSGQRATFYTVDSTGRRTVVNTQWMSRVKRQRSDVAITVTPRTKKLHFNLGSYPKTAVPPLGLTIDSLVVAHFLPKQAALDSLDKLLFDYKPLIDGRAYIAPDSLAAAFRPPWLRAPKGGDGR